MLTIVDPQNRTEKFFVNEADVTVCFATQSYSDRAVES